MTKRRLFGFLLIITAVWITIESTQMPKWNAIQKSSAESKFLADFESHIAKLSENKSLAKQLGSIQFIRYRFHSTTIQNHLGNQPLPVSIHPTGKYALESDYIEIPSQENDQFILQLSLIELDSNNKIWENSENYRLPLKSKTK